MDLTPVRHGYARIFGPLSAVACTILVGLLASNIAGLALAYPTEPLTPRTLSVYALLITETTLLGLFTGWVGAAPTHTTAREHLVTAWRQFAGDLAGVGWRTPRRWWWLAAAAALGIALHAPGRLIVTLMPPTHVNPLVVPLEHYDTLHDILWGLAIAPPAEEPLYRAPLLALAYALANRRHDRPLSRPQWLVVIVTTLLITTGFGLTHLATGGLANVISAGIGGLAFAWLALGSRSLLPPLLAHGTYNATVALLI